MSGIRVIAPVFQARIWGSRDLRAWYPERGLEAEPIGEAWISPPACPVLIKMLFPAERLSVQVHPDDAYAAAHGLGCGKSEAWYVVAAEAGARLGVGLRAGVGWSELEPACRAGRGAELLDWIEVRPGDVVNVPAGTIHAIGPGVVLCEVQQASDNTFRLDDYGRGRQLHLEHGLAVARATTGGLVAHELGIEQSGVLLTTPYFQLLRHQTRPGWTLPPAEVTRWVVNLAGEGPVPRGCAGELAPGTPLAATSGGTWLEVRDINWRGTPRGCAPRPA